MGKIQDILDKSQLTVVGIDQSYSNLGLSVVKNGSLASVTSFKLSKFGATYAGRVAARELFREALRALTNKHKPDIIVMERIRLVNKWGINKHDIITMSQLITTVLDESYPIPVVSVDTRSFKAKVLGNASANKEDAIKFIKDKFDLEVDHDSAEAICIALYVWEKKPKLEIEK